MWGDVFSAADHEKGTEMISCCEDGNVIAIRCTAVTQWLRHYLCFSNISSDIDPMTQVKVMKNHKADPSAGKMTRGLLRMFVKLRIRRDEKIDIDTIQSDWLRML